MSPDSTISINMYGDGTCTLENGKELWNGCTSNFLVFSLLSPDSTISIYMYGDGTCTLENGKELWNRLYE